jgi:hypothetical protein
MREQSRVQEQVFSLPTCRTNHKGHRSDFVKWSNDEKRCSRSLPSRSEWSGGSTSKQTFSFMACSTLKPEKTPFN